MTWIGQKTLQNWMDDEISVIEMGDWHDIWANRNLEKPNEDIEPPKQQNDCNTNIKNKSDY